MTAEDLYDDIFYGRVQMCAKCRRKREQFCSNRDCMRECERMVKEEKQEEQMKLF